jgi:hypothetical protein
MPIVHLFGRPAVLLRTDPSDRSLRRLGMASPGPRAPLDERESTAPEPSERVLTASMEGWRRDADATGVQ